MPYELMKRPWSVKLLIVLELFYALLGVVSGLLLIADPSGAGLGLGPDIRERIPFQSFLPVGLFLFTIYGIGSIIVAYGAVTRKEGALRPISERFGHHWAWVGGLAQMGVLVVWLVVEGLLIGLDYPATYFTIIIGVAIFLTLLPRSTRRYYALSASTEKKG